MKVNESRVKIDSSLLPGIDVLSAEERENFAKVVDSLERFSQDKMLADNIKEIKTTDRPFYVMKVDNSLRIAFRLNQDNNVEIINLFRQEAIEYMFGRKK